MIKLTYPTKPAELTDVVVEQLTAEFKADKTKSVWQKDYIKSALLSMSFNKCCFCEAKIDEESKYMEVEHFHPKSLYEDDVVIWENLLPICKRCNTKKLNHDTKQEPMIHPAKDNPKEHLYLQNYWFYKKTILGQTTIDSIYLNDKHRLIKKRAEIGNVIIEQLHDIFDSIAHYLESPTTRNRNKIIAKLKNVLIECCPESEYSATAATVLLSNPNYQEIKQLFGKNNLWSDEFKELEKQVEFCALI